MFLTDRNGEVAVAAVMSAEGHVDIKRLDPGRRERARVQRGGFERGGRGLEDRKAHARFGSNRLRSITYQGSAPDAPPLILARLRHIILAEMRRFGYDTAHARRASGHFNAGGTLAPGHVAGPARKGVTQIKSGYSPDPGAPEGQNVCRRYL